VSAHGNSALAWRIAAALVLGAIAGLLLGPRAAVLGELAVVIIQVLKALAAPLVFFAVTEACSRTNIRWSQGGRLLVISLTNAAVAGSIAITLDHLIPIGGIGAGSLREALLSGSKPADAGKPMELSLGGVIDGVIPKSVVQPFVDNQVIGAVALALFFGLALRKAKSAAQGEVATQLGALDAAISGALRVLMTGIGWIIAIVPLAVFGVLAKVVGQTGFSSFRSLGYFLGIVCLGFAVQGVLYYGALLQLFARLSPRSFYRFASEALLTAFGTGSSLATLPVTLRTLQEKMQVRAENARLAAMVGTNLNHDGILLYEAATALFIARVLGIPLDPGQQALVVGIAAIAAFGIGGIPDAGLITLSLVLSTLKLPLAAVPLLLPLDWFIGRLRATLNVTSDLVVGNLLEAWERRRPAVVAGAHEVRANA
jgi:DAACS family dicarboxylate/amino acid:cation (Na+ or H+) symporter